MDDDNSIPRSADRVTQERGSGVDELVLLEQVKLLYSHLPASQAVTLLIGVVLAIVQSAVIELPRVAGWFAALALVALGRVFLGLLFARASPSADDISRWQAYFLAGAVASGAVWGSSAVLLYAPDSMVHQVFLAFALGGMVAGSATILTPVFAVFVMFALFTLLPMAVRYLSVGDDVHYAMGVMAGIFVIAMVIVGKRIHDATKESLQLRFENRELIVYLSSARSHVESINANLLATQDALKRSNEELEQRVAERTAELQSMDRRKDDFLAMLSHELRNPLAPIRNSIYILGRVDATSQQARQAKEIIERQTQHITRLVDDLLDVTRVARGKIELRRQRIDLAELVIRTGEDHGSVLRALGIDLAVNVPSFPVWSVLDPTRIAQLMGNLLQNAAKYTPAAGKITLDFQVVGDAAEIRVTDTGAGIAPELLPVLFEPLTQGQRSLARTEGGLGLGLALVKGITELHGGTVGVESGGPGKGSAFTVRLPVIAAGIAELAPSASVTCAARNRNVLVVDDNRDAADSLAQVVKMFGHSAEVAYDGTTAIDKARAILPEVVLCDLGLPGMSGFDVARALRTECADIRLIAVSGYAQLKDITNALEAGFDAHVAKPVDAETVRRLLM